MNDLISREAGILILVQYNVYGVHSVHGLYGALYPDDKRFRERRFCAETDEEVIVGIIQLYNDICETYPIELFPNRKIDIFGVYREIVCDVEGIIKEGFDND